MTSGQYHVHAPNFARGVYYARLMSGLHRGSSSYLNGFLILSIVLSFSGLYIAFSITFDYNIQGRL
jgi:hypothetical protein